MTRLSKAKRERAELLLEHAATIQTVLWDLLHDIEETLGCEISGTEDLSGYSVDDLLKIGNK